MLMQKYDKGNNKNNNKKRQLQTGTIINTRQLSTTIINNNYQQLQLSTHILKKKQ